MYKYQHPSCWNMPEPSDCQDPFSVWAPGLQDSCAMNTAFNLFAMEVEEQREKEREAQNFYGIEIY